MNGGRYTSRAMLTIAVSSRSLFHLEESNAIFEQEGQLAYDRHMAETAHEVLEPGGAFHLVRKLLALNSPGPIRDRVEVILLSRNSTASSNRVMNSVMAHGLDIEQAIFTSGGNRFAHASKHGVDLFLSATGIDTKAALDNGIASATVMTGPQSIDINDHGVCIAFDGDAVIFSDESDAVFRAHGLQRFIEHEIEKLNDLLGDGPFKRLVHALAELRTSLGQGGAKIRATPDGESTETATIPLSLALVTARGSESGQRVLKTLEHWGLTLDVIRFADGADKGPILKALKADFFFDDTHHNIRSALEHNIPSGHVPYGAGGIVRVHAHGAIQENKRASVHRGPR